MDASGRQGLWVLGDRTAAEAQSVPQGRKVLRGSKETKDLPDKLDKPAPKAGKDHKVNRALPAETCSLPLFQMERCCH